MASTPKIIGPDGVAREVTLFSTTIPSRFFRGTMGSDTVDMQISIRGGAFTSDPDLIIFEGSTFSFPNPISFPEGLELAAGMNVIEVRSISFAGAVSASARLDVTLVQESDIGLVGTVPTNVSIEQFQDEVEVRVEGVNDSRFQGINFYASRFQGGGATGYQLINRNAVTDFVVVQETTTIGSLQVDNPVATNPDGTVAADPLYVNIQETQTSSNDIIQNLEDITLTPELAAAITEQEQEALLRTDFIEVFEVPETTRVIRSTYTLDSLVSRAFYSFRHNRQFGPASNPPTIPVGEFASAPLTEPLFYVTTAIYFDPQTQLEVESSFSAEVVGKPVIIDENVGTFPSPARLEIVQQTIQSITRTTPQIAVQPGAVIRDTFVDPVSNEVTRLRLLVDFMYRIQSFDTLLQIDGIESNGGSTSVIRSPYKQALGRVFALTNPNDIQTIIDTSFNQLAARNDVFRNAGVRARGFVTFFTQTRPTETLFIPLGTRVASGSVQFATTTDASIPIGNVAAFFNPTNGLYQIDVPVEASLAGDSSNLGAGQIRTIVSGLSNLSVTNRNATFGGTNLETNLQLAERARNAPSSVDSGTERGTLQVAADVAGVREAMVVSSGDDMMQRDYDTDFMKHVGGKADVWIRGSALGNVTDTFAFTFEIATDVQFVVLGNILDYRFRALDVNLSAANPIAEMLDDEAIGLGLRNASSGLFFDLTNVVIEDYRTIKLSTSEGIIQPPVTFGDVVLGDYRYVTSTEFVFTRQPVDSVVSVTGQVTGLLPDDNWEFNQPDDPLIDGRSTRAQSFLNVIQTNGVPSGDSISITGESHIMLGTFDELVDNLGANPLTVSVFDTGGTIEYRGPDDPSGVSDYVIIPGAQTTALAIRRTSNSNIRSGQTILVDYDHAENFTVRYQLNQVIPTVQLALDAQKHITADILAKAGVPVPVDITATIVSTPGTRASTIDTSVRTNLTTFLRALSIGSAVRQSDIIAVIDNTRGISYVETPLTKLTRAAGADVVREEVVNESPDDVVLLLGDTITPYSTDTVRTWLFTDALNNPTSTGGGPDTVFRAVFQDDFALTLQTADPQNLKNATGNAYIIGDQGIVIPNYSDDITISIQNPSANTAAEIQQIRRNLTANRIMISLSSDDRPINHSYRATYTVAFVSERTQDIEASEIEYFVTGNFTLTFTEDRRLGQ